MLKASASETVETRLKNQGDVRSSALYNSEQYQRSDVTSSDKVKSSRNGMRERSGYIDIVYAEDKTNGSVKRFGNLGTDPRGNRRVYGIEDVMKVFKISFSLIYDLLSIIALSNVSIYINISESFHIICKRF